MRPALPCRFLRASQNEAILKECKYLEILGIFLKTIKWNHCCKVLKHRTPGRNWKKNAWSEVERKVMPFCNVLRTLNCNCTLHCKLLFVLYNLFCIVHNTLNSIMYYKLCIAPYTVHCIFRCTLHSAMNTLLCMELCTLHCTSHCTLYWAL